MGQVWAARDRVIGRPVAVKVLYDHGDTEAAEMFLREARAAGSLVHPAVVTVHDLGSAEDGTLFLVMERLTGRDLASVVHDDGPVPVESAVAWVDEICAALTVAHRDGLIHRDIKPANLFLTSDHRIKVLDFGIARYVEAVSASASRVIGTLAYMPPERIHGRVGDHRGDLYSLGCVLHELLVGQPPFGDTGSVVTLALAHAGREPEPVRGLRPDVPQWLERLTLDLLAKDPGDRPADAAIVRERLGAAPARATVPAEVRRPEGSGVPVMRVTHPGGSIEISVTAPLPAHAGNGRAPSRVAVSGRAVARPDGLRARRIVGHRGPVTSVVFSGDGGRLASAGGDVRIWDANTAESVAEPALEHAHTVLSAHEGALLVGLSRRRLAAWEGVGATPVKNLDVRATEVYAAAAPDVGSLVAVAGTSGAVVLLDTHTWSTHVLSPHVPRGNVRALACSPHSGLVAAGHTNGDTRVWNLAATDDVRSGSEHTGWVRALAFSPDGRLLASAGDDGLIRIRDVVEGRAVGEPLSGHAGWIHGLAFSPDGLLLASCGQDRTLRLWDPLDGRRIGPARTTPTERPDDPPTILAVAFSPDGGRIATGDAHRGVTLWSVVP